MSVRRRPGKPAKKYSQAARLHDVIRILEARFGATVDELAEECGVTRRTVYRDLEAIGAAGYPLVPERQDDGTVLYRFMTGFKNLPPITFSLQELMTLHLCRGQLGFLQGTPFQEDLDAIFGRIRSGLPPRSVAHLERIAEAVAPRFQGVHDYRPQHDILAALREALLFQYRIRLHYTPARREPEVYLFDPYTLLFTQGALYLGGYAHNRKALRLFLIDRVQAVEVTRERFEVPEDFSAEQLTGGAFGLVREEPMTVRARFAAEIAHLVTERIWHPSQRREVDADGSVTLTIEAGGRTEILAWLYGFVPHVEVLEPKALREAFVAGLRQGLARHGS
ncbi:MAG: WYL domain-containing protein [Deltaproteobacteria bacterium]|nr:MAG: WYL domain-containing protein [Deltaproteobacteria bacterium]